MKFKPAFISLLFFLAISSHDVPAKELRPSNDISCYLSNDCVFKKASPPEQSFPLSSIEDYLPCREGYDYFQPQPLNNPPRLCSRYGLNDFETESMPCDITDRICQSITFHPFRDEWRASTLLALGWDESKDEYSELRSGSIGIFNLEELPHLHSPSSEWVISVTHDGKAESTVSLKGNWVCRVLFSESFLDVITVTCFYKGTGE